ncbi:hypothetical protein BD410DRAFT_877968 [Rickenella mellea]|uniref:Uncharacterized protein n=1 Tax=Rickenella mellea TaxID=50990 RepID=A0A4Y7PTR5_9AGAM|nr:hypothetical protein BD410DRAFT_877968 [Rickenella mellea]
MSLVERPPFEISHNTTRPARPARFTVNDKVKRPCITDTHLKLRLYQVVLNTRNGSSRHRAVGSSTTQLQSATHAGQDKIRTRRSRHILLESNSRISVGRIDAGTEQGACAGIVRIFGWLSPDVIESGSFKRYTCIASHALTSIPRRLPLVGYGRFFLLHFVCAGNILWHRESSPNHASTQIRHTTLYVVSILAFAGSVQDGAKADRRGHCEDEYRRRGRPGVAIIQDDDEPDLSPSSTVHKLGHFSHLGRSISHLPRSERESMSHALRLSHFSGRFASLGQAQTRCTTYGWSQIRNPILIVSASLGRCSTIRCFQSPHHRAFSACFITPITFPANRPSSERYETQAITRMFTLRPVRCHWGFSDENADATTINPGDTPLSEAEVGDRWVHCNDGLQRGWRVVGSHRGCGEPQFPPFRIQVDDSVWTWSFDSSPPGDAIPLIDESNDCSVVDILPGPGRVIVPSFTPSATPR